MDLFNKVCPHCGGAVMVRYGNDLTHVRVRGAPVCKRLPELEMLVTRRQYDASLPEPVGVTDSEGGEPA